jgi:hypothetical protein
MMTHQSAAPFKCLCHIPHIPETRVDLKGLLFGSTPEPSMKLKSEFDVRIERKVNDKPVHFNARVKGHFVPKGGKAEFVAEEIYVHGMPGVNLRDLFPRDLKDVQKYALSVEYPRALARNLSLRGR